MKEKGTRSVMDIVEGNGHGDPSSNVGQGCISQSPNTLGKGVNQTMGKIVG